MSALSLLWWLSVLLAGVSVLWMMGLILARLFRENSEVRRQHDREALSGAYLAIMEGVPGAAAGLLPFQHRSRLMAETLLEVLNIVRGQERDRLIRSLFDLGVDARLRARLTRGSRTGRLAAVEALAAFGSAETRDALRALHSASRDAEIRIGIVRTLIDIGDAPRVQDLMREMAGQADRDSLQYAPVLRRLAIDRPEDALEALAVSEFNTAARVVLIDAVGATGDYRALEPLTRETEAVEVLVRTAAIRALGVLAHPGSAGVVARALTDTAWEVRAEAAGSAADLNVAGLIPGLLVLLDDPVWWVRFRAAEALASMRGEGVAALRQALGSARDTVRRAAAMALAERGLSQPAVSA
jgi:HEAT repeat protein